LGTPAVWYHADLDIKNPYMHLNSGDLSKTIHAAMNAGSRACIVYYGSTQHALQHELFFQMVTILEIHILILDVCVIHCNAIYFLVYKDT